MKLLVILFILKSYARVKIFIYFWNLWFSTFFLMFQAVTWRVRKNFLHFSKWNFFTLCLKNPVLFLGEPLRSSISSCFHFFMFPFLLFLHFLRGFYCWLHFFTSLFLHFLWGTSFLCCCTESATDLRELFLLSGVFCLTPLLNIWSNLLLSRLPRGRQYSLEDCRTSHGGSKHRPCPSSFLNHTVFSKRN